MSNAQALREIRSWLNESRMVNLAGFLVVNGVIKEREAETKRKLLAELRGLDEFANSTAQEEYQPE